MELNLKHVASLLVSQLLRDVQNRVKAEVVEINDDPGHPDLHKLLYSEKKELTEKGILLTKGNRDVGAIRKVAITYSNEPEEESRVSYTKGFNSSQSNKSKMHLETRTSRGNCYICGNDHFWRYCPKKRCPACGQKAHTLKDCNSKQSKL